MNSRWKWVCVLSLLSILIWACTKEEEPPSEPRTQEPPATVEKSMADKTASEQQSPSEPADRMQKQEEVGEGDLEKGEEVYQQSCASCHDQGIAGAPKLTDTAEWEQRLKKGMETLNDHAINGFQGETGMMPAKGGNPALSDYEVEAAVAYMIAEATK